MKSSQYPLKSTPFIFTYRVEKSSPVPNEIVLTAHPVEIIRSGLSSK